MVKGTQMKPCHPFQSSNSHISSSGVLPEAAELVLVDDGKSEGGGLLAQLHPLHFEEVDVRGEGPEQVEDVVTAVVPDDPLALDRGTEADLLLLVVDDRVGEDLELGAGRSGH